MKGALGKNQDPRWLGETAICIASGPSLNLEDVAFVQSKKLQGLCKVIAVNREFLTAPWADVLYIADFGCWNVYLKKIRESFTGELWTVDELAARSFKVNLIKRNTGLKHLRVKGEAKRDARQGYSREPGTINTGGNSGFQAVHLAAYWGANRIILLGYDMQRTGGLAHHYGNHEGSLPNGQGFPRWIPEFKPLVMDLKRSGVTLVNATRETALPEKWIPRLAIQDAL